MKRFAFVVVLSVVARYALADNTSTDPPIYQVNHVVDVAPVIDGLISGSEWDLAADAAGDWVNVNTGAADSHNLRFRMLWDAENLYLLGQTDFTGFQPPSDDFDDPSLDGFTYTPSFIVDPNIDGEDLNAVRTDSQVDGYHISWSIDEGFTSRAPTAGDPSRALRDPKNSDGLLINDYIPGLFLESNVNALSGNAGGWDRSDEGPNENYRDDTHPGLRFAQNADNFNLNGSGTGGALFEWSIAWSELNATDPDKLLSVADGDAVMEEIEDPFDPSQLIDNPNFLGPIGAPDPRFADPESEQFLENGLFATNGPAEDDVWAFEIGALTPDSTNTLVSWSEPMGGDETRESLVAWGNSGHGRLVFVGPPIVEPDPVDPDPVDPDPVDPDPVDPDPVDPDPVDPDPPVVVNPGEFDCNDDGALDSGDLVCVTAETVAGTLEALNLLAGDINGDGEVAFGDFLTLSSNFGNTDGVNYTTGDIDVNGEVAFGDFLTISGNFGRVPPEPAPIDPDPVVPDPVDPDPVDTDPVDTDPVVPDPIEPDPVVPDPVDPDPVDPDPVDPDPGLPFDCTGDGVLDSTDLACATAETVTGTLEALNLLPGDLNGDGEVAFGDFLTLSSNFGNTDGVNYTTGDIDVNGEVAFGDFLTISGNFGRVPANATAAIPEPSGFSLLLLGCFSFRRLRRR